MAQPAVLWSARWDLLLSPLQLTTGDVELALRPALAQHRLHHEGWLEGKGR